jgi:peroxiredoxin
MGKALKSAVFFILVIGLLLSGCSSGTGEPASQPGGPAPDFQMESLDGQVVSLSGLRGSPVMLNFWASWCGPCRLEMPFIQGAYEDGDWQAQGLVILAVNVGESPSTAAGFMEENGLSFTVLSDTGRDVAAMYGVSGIPVTYFIDESGIIVDRHIGAFTSKEQLDWRLLNTIVDIE